MTARKQAATRRVTTRSIVGSHEFERGLNEVRTGLPFNPDHDSWNYERGRCFGRIAPLDMPSRIVRMGVLCSGDLVRGGRP